MAELGENAPAPLDADGRPDWLVEMMDTTADNPDLQSRVVLVAGAAVAALVVIGAADLYYNVIRPLH